VKTGTFLSVQFRGITIIMVTIFLHASQFVV